MDKGNKKKKIRGGEKSKVKARDPVEAYHMRRGPTILEFAGRIMPDGFITTLSYPITRGIVNAASPTQAARWRTNGIYDLDPLLLTTAVPGFVEFMAFYSYYRVLTVTARALVSNLEPNPVSVYFVTANTDPGTSGASYNDYASNRFGRTKLLGSVSGASNASCTMRHNVTDIVGDDSPLTDLTFRGTSSTNPTDLVYFGVGALNPVGNLTNGILLNLTIDMRVLFSDRILLVS
jgi:hypothetical protein